MPIYENISDAKTVKELMQANPPQTTEIGILAGSGVNDTGKVRVFYQPKEARGIIELSNKVAWTNRDMVAHTVTSDSLYPIPRNGQFHSGAIQPGETYEYIFDHAGEYQYHCLIHPSLPDTSVGEREGSDNGELCVTKCCANIKTYCRLKILSCWHWHS